MSASALRFVSQKTMVLAMASEEDVSRSTCKRKQLDTEAYSSAFKKGGGGGDTFSSMRGLSNSSHTITFCFTVFTTLSLLSPTLTRMRSLSMSPASACTSLGQGGGEHESLALRPHLAHHLAHLRLEAHIQHAISLMHAEASHTPQIGSPRFQKVDQAAPGVAMATSTPCRTAMHCLRLGVPPYTQMHLTCSLVYRICGLPGRQLDSEQLRCACSRRNAQVHKIPKKYY